MYLSDKKKPLIVLSLIIFSSILLVIVSYDYFTQTKSKIEQLAIYDFKINSEIEAHSISSILSIAISSVINNMQMIANAPAMTEQNFSKAQILFDLAQRATSNLTDTYYLLDRDGKLITYSNINNNDSYVGIDLSERDYYKIPLQTNEMYVGTVIESNDRVPRIYISLPLIVGNQDDSSLSNNTEQFEGVIVAGIAATVLGDFLEKQVHPEFTGSLGLLDREGTIIHTQNKSFIGKDYFGSEFQSLLSTLIKDKRDDFNTIINKSLISQNGSDEFYLGGNITTIAYDAIIASNNLDVDATIDNDRLGTLFTVTPHAITDDVLSLVGEQELISFFIIFSIVVISLIASSIVLGWNKSLQKIVEQKTSDLKNSIQQLKESNEKLNLTKISLEKSNNEILTTNAKLRKANEDLKLHDKIQNEFINIAAHELRTPTQAITGNLELIEMAYLPSISQSQSGSSIDITMQFKDLLKNNKRLTEFANALFSVYRNSGRLEKLVNNLLDVSRIDMKKLEMHKEYFNLNEKITNVIKDISTKSLDASTDGLNKVDIIFKTQQDPIIVFADRIRMYEVVSNLIINAIKFSEGKPINISVTIPTTNPLLDSDTKPTYSDNVKLADRFGNRVIVSIRDYGKGIEEEIMPRLFTKFTTGSLSGTGLGLYIVKNIVEAHGGEIFAKNNKDGPGATFTFSIPLSS